MVRIPGSVSQLGLLGLEQSGTNVPEFLADKYEVTNREYKVFVDAGGYANPAYWRFPVIDGGREIPLAAALARFTDRSGRPGPSTWRSGVYPDGLADHPVAGVSWYEAAAYAAWAGKELPTVYHWTRLADTSRAKFLVRFSNFNGKSTTAAGSLSGLSSYGVYDVAGNVREWVMNAARNAGERYILGGGYSDPSHAFNDACAQSALDRAPINGFRLIRELPGASAPALAQPLVKVRAGHDRAWLVVRTDKVVHSGDPKL
jgi:formylglycine-generating enzyme required for sulfatase activity